MQEVTSYAAALTEISIRLNLSQDEMSKKIGVPLITMHRWIKGKSQPKEMARVLLDRFISANSTTEK